MGLIAKVKGGLFSAAVKVFVGRWWRDGIEGKRGEGQMAFLKKLHGLRSAIMAVVLLGEVLAKGFGYESGPVFSVVHTVFAAIGWSGTEPVFDPAAAGAAILTLYAVVQRVRAYLKGRGAGAEG